MLKLLLKFWPVWVPLVLYVVWLLIAASRAAKTGGDKPRFAKGKSWTLTWIATLLIAVAMFVFIGVSDEKVDGQYVPARTVDGEIVPGHFKQDSP